MTAELPEVAQTTPASPFLLNPQEVWCFSQVSYLLPRSAGRPLANQKLGQTFRAPSSWTSSPKPHAGSWPLYTLTVPFSGASWVSPLMPHLAPVYSEARAPLPSELAQSPLVRFTTLQKCNWVLSGAKTLERGGEGLRGMWEHARGGKCLSHQPYCPPPHGDSNYTEMMNTLFHCDRHRALTPHKPWGPRGGAVLGWPLVLLQIWVHLSAVMEVLLIHSQSHQSVIWPCSKTWGQISSTRNIISMCLLVSENLMIRSMNIICVWVHACVCLHVPNVCHVVWYRAQKDTCLEKPQTILVGSMCNLGKSMGRGKDIK